MTLHLTTLRYALRRRPGLRIGMTVFVSIALIEAAILIPSTRNFERDQLQRLSDRAGAVVTGVLTDPHRASDTEILARLHHLLEQGELAGGALYDGAGESIGAFGEPPRMVDARSVGPQRSADGRRYEVILPRSAAGQASTVVARLDSSAIARRVHGFVGRVCGLVLLISSVVCGTTALFLRRELLHDGVTGLPNRQLLLRRVDRALGGLRRQPEHGFALLLLRIDRLKVVHDSLGGAGADRFVVQMSQRLGRALASGDTLARTGRDELAVLMNGIDGETEARTYAQRLQAQLAEPILIDALEVYATVTMGLTSSQFGYVRGETMIQDAAIALHAPTAPAPGEVVSFDLAMRSGTTRSLHLESDLRRALESGDQLRLHYQPVIALDHGGIAGFEALVRWQHPERGLMSPADFVPLAEETGLIVPMGRWVLAEAVRQLAAWQRHDPYGPTLFMGVNLSTRQLTEPSLIDEVAQILTDARVDPGTLKLEITESLLMQDPEAAEELLHQLKSLGVRLAIDDFGTGHSSLAYLRRFPFDMLKIDRSFVRDLARGSEPVEIVRTIIDLARILNLGVIAEGAETPQDVDALRQLGCDLVQGYVFSPPVAAEEAAQLLAAYAVTDQSERALASAQQSLTDRPCNR